jgi:tetratricopeptide (TPR) repeat protein
LLQRAVEADPDSMIAASRLSTVWSEDGHAERLVDVFRTAIKSAIQPEAVIMLGSEIARVARDELKDLPTAIEAMQRVRAAAPDHIPSLLTLSELCIAQRAWPEAVDALETVVSTSHESAPRLTALFALASVYERVLDRKADAERALRTALSIEPSNPRALRALLRHLAQMAPAAGKDTRSEQAQLLEQLADVEPDFDQKAELLGELASMRARMGDMSGSERALIAAVAHAPSNAALFARLAAGFKTPQGTYDDASYARALEQLVAVGQRLGHVDARWLAVLGQLEVEKLARVREGVTHLQQAVTLDPALTETRYELAVAYSKAQSHPDTIRTLTGMLSPDPRPLLSLADPAAALGLLERSLNAERRSEEALAISELRAVAGDLDDGRYSWLRGRRPRPLEANQAVLDRATLVTHVLPAEGRHVLLEVAAAVYGIEAKMLRSDIAEIGISSRDRISSRVAHPTRIMLERAMRILGLSDVELVITPNVPRTRVLTQDVPWVVVPASLVELPEMAQLAAIGRALARIAFGVPWLEELPGPHIEALLVAAARHAVPSYARDMDLSTEPLITQYEGPVAKTISRRQRKLLEELASHIAAPAGRPILVTHLVAALARGELRTAYLLTGDLLATIDDVRGADAALLKATEQPGRSALGAVLEHPYAGDVARFATTPEAAALKRRLGTAWGT